MVRLVCVRVGGPMFDLCRTIYLFFWIFHFFTIETVRCWAGPVDLPRTPSHVRAVCTQTAYRRGRLTVFFLIIAMYNLSWVILNLLSFISQIWKKTFVSRIIKMQLFVQIMHRTQSCDVELGWMVGVSASSMLLNQILWGAIKLSGPGRCTRDYIGTAHVSSRCWRG